MVYGRCIKHPSTDAGGRFVRQIFSASEKHDALLKSSCTHACQSEIYSSFNCRQLERKRKRGTALNLMNIETLRKQPTWSLKAMIKALSLPVSSFLNTEEDNKRLENAKIVIKEREIYE